MTMQALFLFGSGMTACLMQVLALRALLAVCTGNELVIGITLAAWLAAVGTGSFLVRFVRRLDLGAAFIASGLLTQPTLLLIEQLPRLFSLVPGETVPLGTTVVAAFLCLFPLGMVLGSQFPLSLPLVGHRVARAYALEAFGAFAGGALFTFVLAGRMPSYHIASALAVLNLSLGLLLRRRALLVPLAVIPMLLSFLPASTGQRPGGAQTATVIESRYGEIRVERDRGQINVYASGGFRYSYPDQQTEELKVHPPLTLHPAPDDVLVIGGSPALLREVLKHPVLRVVFVEIDPVLIGVSRDLLSPEDRAALADPRLSIRTEDARRFVAAQSRRFDLVLVNLPEPSTADINRFYTTQFFRQAKQAMKPGGVLCLELPSSFGYIGRRMQVANSSILASLRAVFPAVAVTSEEYGGLYASDRAIERAPALLERRFAQRRISTASFYPELFRDIFDRLKVGMVEDRLGQNRTMNTDERPAAYLYNLLLWTGAHGGRLLDPVLGLSDSQVLAALAFALAGAVALSVKRHAALPYAVLTTGYASMAFSTIVLLAFQAAYGYVYEMIGLLTALFMAGLALGSFGAERIAPSVGRLMLLDMAVLVLLLASPLFFLQEQLYALAAFLCGIIGGIQFPAAARLDGAPAGSLYAMDLAGSVAGALLTAVLFVPLLGTHGALFATAAVKVSSLVALFTLHGRAAGVATRPRS